MTPLLLLTGVLLLVSGGLKARAGLRAGLGIPILSLLELVAAAAWSAAALAGAGAIGSGVLFVPAGVLLVLVSSVHFTSRLSAHRRGRAASEGRRLANYVQYLSGSDDTSRTDT